MKVTMTMMKVMMTMNMMVEAMMVMIFNYDDVNGIDGGGNDGDDI